jgi:hypothetical protein
MGNTYRQKTAEWSMHMYSAEQGSSRQLVLEVSWFRDREPFAGHPGAQELWFVHMEAN